MDSNWTIKLTNFRTDEIIAEKLLHHEIKEPPEDDSAIGEQIVDRSKPFFTCFCERRKRYKIKKNLRRQFEEKSAVTE